MKKKLAALLAIAVMSMSSVYAAESQGPISRWLDGVTGKVAKKEQSAYQKQQEKQQKIAAKKKAKEQKLAKKRAKAKQKELERKKKAAERQKRVEKKKKQFKDLFSKD